MSDNIGLSNEFLQGDTSQASVVGSSDMNSPSASDNFQGGDYKGILNLAQLRPGRWVTIDITQDDPKKYEVLKVGTDLVQVRDEETQDEFLIPIYKVSLVDLQTPYDDHELDKYSTNPNIRRLAHEKTIEKRKRHEGEKDDSQGQDKKDQEKDSDSDMKSKANKSIAQQGQEKKTLKGKPSFADRFKARMYPPTTGTHLPEDAKPTDQSGTGIKAPRLSHMFGKFRGFLDVNKKP
jgi:hypothetical protein